MDRTHLFCCHCNTDFELKPNFHPCPDCGNPLQVKYQDLPMDRAFEMSLRDGRSSGLEAFRARLPVPETAQYVSLGEGNTPLLKLSGLSAELGLSNLFIKNESANPTWSFKDRLNSVNATIAKVFGFNGIVASSTGNHGASAAGYAAAAGLKSVILFPHGTPNLYLKQVRAYGGVPILMNWKDRGDLLTRLVNEFGWYPSKSSLPAPISNPLGLEGYKTIAYELAAEMRVDGLPSHVFVPVGSGDNFFGIYRGFAELVEMGVIEALPSSRCMRSLGK